MIRNQLHTVRLIKFVAVFLQGTHKVCSLTYSYSKSEGFVGLGANVNVEKIIANYFVCGSIG